MNVKYCFQKSNSRSTCNDQLRLRLSGTESFTEIEKKMLRKKLKSRASLQTRSVRIRLDYIRLDWNVAASKLS